MINELLTSQWRTFLQSYQQLFVGFSGGLDSTVLLHALVACPSLLDKVVAVHVNHGLSSQAPCWEEHCQRICRQWQLPLIVRSVEFNRCANIEEEARTARYEVFTSLVQDDSCLLLGHHLNDQAETVLLNLVRGAGLDGLMGMQERSQWQNKEIIRPLLSYPREQLITYALAHQLTWVEDESNQDSNYSRNYLRQHIVPLLQARWPSAVKNIARTAAHCRQARTNLDVLAHSDGGDLALPYLDISTLIILSKERLVNVLRTWLKKNKIKSPSTAIMQRIVNEVIDAKQDANPLVTWGSISIQRYQKHLYLEKHIKKELPETVEWQQFPLPLNLVNGQIITVSQQVSGLVLPNEAKISIRFRQGGERLYWHGQHHQLKKLFQQWNIPPWQRPHIPLIFVNDQLAAIPGYAYSDLFYNDKQIGWVFTLIDKDSFSV